MVLRDEPMPAALAVEEEPFPIETVDTLALLMEDTTSAALGALEGDELARVERAVAWRITDDGGAEWAMRHRNQQAEAATAIREQADEWRRRITEWERQQLRGPQERMTFFEAHLQDYAIRRREETAGKVKTVNLPSGKVSTTGSSPRPIVVDEEVFVAWAQENAPDLVRTKHEPAASKFSEHLMIDTVMVGWARTYRLECGHEQQRVEDAELPPAAELPCGKCEPDPIDGGSETRAVAEVLEDEPVHEAQVVWGEKRERVPGLGVKPEDVKATVKA